MLHSSNMWYLDNLTFILKGVIINLLIFEWGEEKYYEEKNF